MIFIGVITALGALVAQFVVSIFYPEMAEIDLTRALSRALIISLLIEEFFKLAVIGKISARSPRRKEVFLNSILIGTGFSLAEISLNCLSQSAVSAGLIFSYLGVFLTHTATSALYGYYFSSCAEKTLTEIIFIFILGGLLHFSFNISVIYSAGHWIIYPVFMAVIAFLYFKVSASSLAK